MYTPYIRVGGDEGYIRRGTGRTVVCFGGGRWRWAINNAPSRGYGQQSDRYFPKGHILYTFIYIDQNPFLTYQPRSIRETSRSMFVYTTVPKCSYLSYCIQITIAVDDLRVPSYTQVYELQFIYTRVQLYDIISYFVFNNNSNNIIIL